MRTLAGALLVLLSLAVLMTPVGAGEQTCRTVTVTTYYLGEPRTQVKVVCTETPAGGATNVDTTGSSSGPQIPEALRGSSNNIDCPGTFLHLAATGSWVKVGEGCRSQGQVPVITLGMIMSRFKSTPIPTSELIVQPPGGKTLVNFATIFRTEANAFTESFRLLGQSIDLRIAPSSFTWRPGDGTSFSTVTPGIAFQEGRSMDDYVSHMYQSATMMHPSVDVTWSAEFRVGGGAWRPVPGTVTKQGSPVDLRVVEGKPVLVDSY